MVGAIDCCKISLRIVGDELDPALISQLLGQEPTHGHRKGENIYGNDGKFRRIGKKGAWRLTATSVEYGDLDVQDLIRVMLEKLTDDLDIWNSITQQFEVDLYCSLFIKDTNRGFTLSADLIQLLGDRRIEIGFEIYAIIENSTT